MRILRQRASRYSLSSFNRKSSTFSCDVVQGPSLLRTSVARPNPSLIHLPGLRSLPFWTHWDGTQNRIAYQDPTVKKVIDLLESNCAKIRQEYERVAPKHKSDYHLVDNEHSLHEGSWDWHSYMLKGKLQGHFVTHFPETASVLQDLRQENLLFEGTPFGFSFFSTLHGQSSIAAHTAPMNFRLRIHLPLRVPEGNCGIRVGGRKAQCREGSALVLDDAFEHEVWNKTDETRVLLLVDIWHPDVTQDEKQDILAMFKHAEDQGWYKS